MPRKTHGKKTRHSGLYRLPDGKWLIRVYATDERTGKKREKEMTLAADMKELEAVAEVHSLRARLAAGEIERAKPARVSLNDCAEQWLEAKSRRVRASTASHLADVLAKHVLPGLGDLYVDALARSDIEIWVANAERATMSKGQPYSRDTISGWWRVLKQFVRDVAAERGVPDPIVRVRPPRGRARGRRERRTLSLEQLGRLVDAVQEVAPDRCAEVLILAWTGMRPGELYALTWPDVDEARGIINIRRAHRHGVVEETKTGDPREVALTPAMAEVLRVHRRALLEAQHPGLKSGLVFPSDTGGFRGPESLYKPLAAAAKKAGIEQRLGAQVLRRTFNTLLLMEGVDRVVLRSLMGHCSEEMTERYSGVSAEAKRAAVEHLARGTR
jgi:integrase